MPVVGPLPIPPAELAEWAELHPTDRMFKYAGVLLDSTPGVLLDPASSALWDRLNPSSPWRDGEEHGDLLTFGTEAFSVTLAEGTARVRHDSACRRTGSTARTLWSTIAPTELKQAP